MIDNSRRQLRLALVIILVLIPIATFGFMIIEHRSFGDSLYFAIITLATVGYGDVVPTSPQGRAFVAILIPFGLSAFAFALQAIYYYVFANPALIEIRQRRNTQKRISHLDKHYIISGTGELADKTVGYIRQTATERHYKSALHQFLWQVANFFSGSNNRSLGLIDVLVVVTHDAGYAQQLRAANILVVLGNPTDETVLLQSGIQYAQALLVLGDNDTETLLTVLTARSINRTMLITAAVLDDRLNQKMLQVGANHVMPTYAAASSFLNNATFRPAVNDYYSTIAMNPKSEDLMLQLRIGEGSHWEGKTLQELSLPAHHQAHIIGIRLTDGGFDYLPHKKHTLEMDETLIIIGKRHKAKDLIMLSQGNRSNAIMWQPLPSRDLPPKSEQMYSLGESEQAIQSMNKHYIICGTGRVAQRSLNALNPDRPFVVISNNKSDTTELLGRGFRVIHGNPQDESVLLKAGIKRAQAIMVTLEDEAESVLTILTSRTMNKQLLITATAYSDEMLSKLERAGADRVVSPFHVAANFMILATTSPDISDFIRHVMFNYQTGLETTELYMENDSPWIGQTIGSLDLRALFDAGVAGIRLPDRKTFVYAPDDDYIIHANEVLIIITPMRYSDELRDTAHGNESKRPTTLRTRVAQSARWTPEEIMKMMNGRS